MKKKLPATPIIPPATITRDEMLRQNISEFQARYSKIDNQEYQFKLSKLLSRVEATDTGNAIRLATRYGHLIHYVPEPDKWYVWTASGIWAQANTGQIWQYAKRTAAYIEMEADLLPLPQDEQGELLSYPQIIGQPNAAQAAIIAKFEQREREANELKQWAKQSRSKRGLQAMIELTKDEPGVTLAKALFDADDMIINLRNGIYDLRQRKLLAHDRLALTMRQANANYEEYASAPAWDRFLDKITNHRPNIARFLRQLAGMGITGERVEDIFTVFYGNGSNGKTVFQEMIRELLGSYASVATPNMFMEKKNDTGDFEMAGLDGVRMLFKDETKQGRSLDESMVKSLTGGSAITAAFKFKDHFTYVPKFTAVLSTNHRPRIAGNDNGIWRRVKEIPFDWNFESDPERKPKADVYAELRAEAPGIFNWCLAGFYDYKENGVFIPPEVQEATDRYKALSDIIGQFIAEDCYIGKGKGFTVTKKELYTAYQDYIEDIGSKALNKPNFGEQLKERGYEDGKTGSMGWYWKGIRLRDKANGEPMQFAEPEPVEEPEPVGVGAGVEVF